MTKVERAIEMLIQTQKDVVLILQSNVQPFEKPTVANLGDALANATHAYNEGVSMTLEILYGTQ